MAITDLGSPSVVNTAFVPLAVEAGIITTIKSLVPLATSLPQLVVGLHDALIGSNAPLAEAMNYQTVRAILDYMALTGDSVVLGDALPVTLNQAGPASVSAGRDSGTPTQVNIGFSTPPEGFKGAIYLDGVFNKISNETGSPTVFDIISNVSAGEHTIRVLYRRESDGAITRFGPIVNIA